MELQLTEKFDKILSKATNITIGIHRSPDPDAFGSATAMIQFIKKKYRNINEVNCIIPDDLPEHLNWIVDNVRDNVIIGEEGLEKKGKTFLTNSDVVILLDMNSTSRLSFYEPILQATQAKIINIDHHPQLNDNFDLIIRDSEASSTCEIVYLLLKHIDKEIIDTNIASSLYSGILGDTGSFSYSCSHPQIYYVTAELIGYDIDIKKLHDLVFNNYGIERMRLLGYVMHEKIQTLKVKDQIVAYYALTSKELEKYNYKPGYLENVVNQALNIKGVCIAASIVERNKTIRISLRSKELPINKFAATCFGGGGHPNASGAVVTDKSLEDCVKIFKDNVCNYI